MVFNSDLSLKIGVILIILLLAGAVFIFQRRHRYNLVILTSLSILIIGVAAHILYGYYQPDYSGHALGSDDAYISYRYSGNLARGRGLVFNPQERVEGYSNFLYVLLMAGGCLVAQAKNIYWFSCFFNILCSLITFIIFYRYVKRRLGEPLAASAAFLLAVSTSLWVYISIGLETPLVLLIQLAMWIAAEEVARGHSQKTFLLCLTMALAILTRADGFLLPLVVILYLLFKKLKRPLIFSSLTVISVSFLYLAWRYSYYGDLFPNTYYVKISGPLIQRLVSAGRQFSQIFLGTGLAPYILIFMISAFTFLISRFKGRKIDLQGNLEDIFAGALLAYWFYAGGDHYRERFLVILFPLGIFMLLKLISRFSLQKSFLFPVILMLIAGLQLKSLFSDPRFNYALFKYDYRIALGEFLGQKHPGKLLAVTAVGKIPYFSDLRTVDMLGLNDFYLARKKVDFFGEPAHNKFDFDYVLSRKPDLIVARVVDLNSLDLSFDIKEEKYRANYKPLYAVNTAKSSAYSNIIPVSNFSREELNSLIARGYECIVLQRK